jgi:class 3 adenylate cyclase
LPGVLVIGATVSVAARLEALASGGGSRCSREPFEPASQASLDPIAG